MIVLRSRDRQKQMFDRSCACSRSRPNTTYACPQQEMRSQNTGTSSLRHLSSSRLKTI
ncbi:MULTISPECIES: hypothetical protein [unclassified Microcoleus]|uniref:hypothetical protein n=1 Tax=unclassified Microcoleus TaxID=2642155 RepID=UPI002FD60A4B